MASIGDIFKETLKPFASPSQFLEDEKLAKRLGKLGADPGSARTRSQIESLGSDRKKFSRLARGFSTNANNIGNEQASVRRAASAAAGADPRNATTQGGTLSESLRRAKARTGIVNRGDKAIRQQRLKDRLKLVRSGLSRKAAAIDLQGTGQQIRAGVNINAQNARDAISGARASAIGGLAGAFAGIAKGNKDDNGSFLDFGQKG